MIDYKPKVIIGHKYKSELRPKNIIEVTGLSEDGSIVSVNFINEEKNRTVSKELSKSDWNEYKLFDLDATIPEEEKTPPSGDVEQEDYVTNQRQETETTKEEKPIENSNDEESSNKESDKQEENKELQHDKDISIIHSKIRKIEEILKITPKKINPNYFPLEDIKNSNEKDSIEDNEAEKTFENTIKYVQDIRQSQNKKTKYHLNEFLWTCAGVDKKLLRSCTIDWAKKAGMGGTILGTSVLATLSGGFAAYTVSNNWLVSIIIGIIWGLIIFNLDRYLVNSMYSDGKATISGKEFLSGLPRIIIAIFLGIVISTPIELKIFEGAINQELHKERNEKTNESAIKAQNPMIKTLENEIQGLETEIEREKVEQKDLRKQLEGEVSGKSGSGIIGYGRKANDIRDDIKRSQRIEKDLSDKKSAKEKELRNLRQRAQKSNSIQVAKEEGLSKRIEMLLRATTFKESNGEKINPLFWVRLFIALMFIILEILPVVNKMMQEDGRYDKLIDLESDSMDRLARVKEYNSFNVIRSGWLARYKQQIMGLGQKKKKTINEQSYYNREEDRDFTRPDDRLKRMARATEGYNEELYMAAITGIKDYMQQSIENIFNEHNKENMFTDENESNNEEEPVTDDDSQKQ